MTFHGTLRFDAFMELALYSEPGGFYAAGGGAGRRGGDFLTSVEVGPLFGRLVARLADRCWEELGRPEDFTLVDAGAGRGTLARSVLAARPACASAGALRYVLVERSATLRRAHEDLLERSAPGVPIESLADLPAGPITGLVVANELLDNLPCRLLERTADGWAEVYVTAGTATEARPAGRRRPDEARRGASDETGALVETLRPLSPASKPPPAPPIRAGALVETLRPLSPDEQVTAAAFAPDAPVGGCIPLASAAGDWVGQALDMLRRGRLVAIDYTDTSASLADRAHGEWVRTYRAGVRGHEPLRDAGTADITVEVPLDQILAAHPGADVCDQTTFLRSLGIDDLVAEGRAVWRERAAVGDLAALEARSRVHEAEALCDPSGLGAFTAAVWRT